MQYTATAFRAVPVLMLSVLLALAMPWLQARGATLGEQKTAVLLVNFQDDTSQPISRTAAYEMVFGTVSDFYWEASYQKTFLSGGVFGWYTIPVSRSVCDVHRFAAEADRIAAAAGVDLSTYERLIYLMPQNSCTGAGFNGGSTLPTRMWMLSNNHSARLVAHELGHNFGLSHSQALECGTAAYGTDCTVKTYGDVADAMGSGGTAHFNAAQKETLGWLGAAGQPAITGVTASGRYTIAPMAGAGSGTKALRIPRGIDPDTGRMNHYYVEYRQPVGFDASLAQVGNLTNGVLVHTGGIDQTPLLLDMTPGSIATSTFDDAGDGALAVGRRYADASAGISITLVSHDASGATVDVVLEGASPAPSNGTLTGSVETGKATYLRGETANMTALVLSDGTPVGGARVRFVVTAPDGSVRTADAASGSDGRASATYRIGRGKSAVGEYRVRADATFENETTSAVTSFGVR